MQTKRLTLHLPTKKQGIALLLGLLCGLGCSGLWAIHLPWLASLVPLVMLLGCGYLTPQKIAGAYRGKGWVLPTLLVGAALAAVMLLETVKDPYYAGWYLPPYKAVAGGLLLSLCVTPTLTAAMAELSAKARQNRWNRTEEPFPKLGFFAAMLAPLLIAWAINFPYLDVFDVQYQLEMIHGQVPLNDVHTMAHTFLLWLVGGQPVVLVAVQLVALAVLLTAFGSWFYRQGLGVFCLTAGFSVFSLCPTVMQIAVSPIKDLPAALCMGAALYYIMRLLAGDLRWSWGHRIAFGASLAFTGLLRHNGFVFVVVAAVWLLIKSIRKRKMIAVVAVCLLCVVGVDAVGYRLLGAKSPANGFAVQVYATGIVAVDRRGGEITPDQRQRMEQLLPMDYVEYCLSNPETEGRTLAQRLCWTRDLGQYTPSEREASFAPLLQDGDGTNDVFNNLFILAAGQHPKEIGELYLELFAQNPWLCISEIIKNTTSIWRLDRGLVLFSHVFYLIGLGLAFVVVGKRAGRLFPVLLPILCNVASVVVAASTDEIRYLLPTFVLTMPTVLFLILHQPMEKEN